MYFSFSCRSICLFVPQQHKLMGSSAQNSSGVQWCRSRVRFNEVPEKVPKVPEKVLPEKVPEKVPGGFGAEPGEVQQGSGEGSGEGLESFGAESTGFRRSFRRMSGRSGRLCKVRFNRVQEKGPVRFNRICGHVTHGNPAEVFPAHSIYWWIFHDHPTSGDFRFMETYLWLGQPCESHVNPLEFRWGSGYFCAADGCSLQIVAANVHAGGAMCRVGCRDLDVLLGMAKKIVVIYYNIYIYILYIIYYIMIIIH